VFQILSDYKSIYNKMKIVLLGDGVMASVTKLVLQDLGISYVQLSRKQNNNLSGVDVSLFHEVGVQTIIINSCSRDFIFRGSLNGDEIFWDYNYSFSPHEDDLPFRVKSYQDGQQLLKVQALEAIKFWAQYLS
jgi:hypothetical protein